MAITGATVLFRCDRSCNVSFRNVTWLKNGSPLDISGTRYGLARNGLLLYIEEVTTGDSGEYACKLQVGKTVYQRYGSLEVMDTHGRNSLACCKHVDSIADLLLYEPCSCMQLWIVEEVVHESRL